MISLWAACSDDPTHIDEPPGWTSPVFADCDGYDVFSSVGSATPDPTLCTGPTDNGLVAVCWDQEQFVNDAMSGPWCTYKRLPAGRLCNVGTHKGFKSACYQP